MADYKVNVEFEDGGSIKTLENLENKLSDLKESIRGVEVGSESFKKLSGEISNTESSLKNLELGFEGLDAEQKASEFGSMASGIADVATGAMALSGALGLTTESSEKMIANLVQGMAVANTFRGGIEGIISAQKLLRTVTVKGAVAQRILNAAMNANPIMILITGIAAAVGAFALFSSATEEAEEDTEALNEAEEKLIRTIKEYNKVVQDSINLRKDRRGIKSSIEQLGIEKQILLQQNKITDLQREQPKNIKAIAIEQEKLGNLEVKLAEEKKKNQLEEFERNISNSEDMIEINKRNANKLTKINTKESKAEAEKLHQINNDLIDELLLSDDRRKEIIIENDNKILKIKLDNENKLQDLKKKGIDTQIEVNSLQIKQFKGIEEIQSLVGTGISKLQEQLEFTRAIQQEMALSPMTDLEIVEEQYEQRNQLIVQKLQEGLINVKQYQQLEKENFEKLEKDKSKIAEDEKKERLRQTEAVVMGSMNALGQLAGAVAANAEEGSKAQENALVAQAIMQGAMGAVGAVSQSITQLGPIAGPIVGGVLAAAIAATTVQSIRSIKAARKGGGSSAPTAPSISSPGSTVAEDSPNINMFGNGNETGGNSSQFGSSNNNNNNNINVTAQVNWADIENVQNDEAMVQQQMQL